MAQIIRIIGRSGSGKTTLLTEVVRLLLNNGTRVAVLKHAHHRVDLDRRGKDSFRYAEAGAVSVTVVSSDKLATFEAPAKEPTLFDLAARVGDVVDLVLAEGFHGFATPYLLLLGPGDEHPGLNEPGELIGVIYSDPNAVGGLERGDPAGVARGIADWLASRRQEDLELERALREAEAFHGHLCPGQLLGVRLAMVGVKAVGVENPTRSKKLITWVEIDRCGADAVQTVTGCKPGKRTLKLVDYGKLAATFLNTETGVAFRVAARSDSRARAADLYPHLERHDAQMAAYRSLPDADLFTVQQVSVEVGEYDRPGKPGARVNCTICGEEVNDHRHVDGDDGPMCRACARGAYYRALGNDSEVDLRL
jgi:molybdopterin-guanine dinucleotide biosynthesis protein MobB